MTPLAPGWEPLALPAGVPGLVGVRTRAPGLLGSLSTQDLAAVAADVGVGLAGHFTGVLLVDAARDATGIELLHLAAGGAAIRTRLDRAGTIRCWVWPISSTVEGGPVRVAEAGLRIGAVTYLVRRRGPLAQVATIDPARSGDAVAEPLAAADLPAFLVRAAGLGPRPEPAGDLVLLPRAELPPLTWSLHWCLGTDDHAEPADAQWSTAVVGSAGRLDVIDTGTRLLRVLHELPDAVAADAREALPQTVPAALATLAPAAVFDLLATLAR